MKSNGEPSSNLPL